MASFGDPVGSNSFTRAQKGHLLTLESDGASPVFMVARSILMIIVAHGFPVAFAPLLS